jgi:hypothetical protein
VKVFENIDQKQDFMHIGMLYLNWFFERFAYMKVLDEFRDMNMIRLRVQISEILMISLKRGILSYGSSKINKYIMNGLIACCIRIVKYKDDFSETFGDKNYDIFSGKKVTKDEINDDNQQASSDEKMYSMIYLRQSSFTLLSEIMIYTSQHIGCYDILINHLSDILNIVYGVIKMEVSYVRFDRAMRRSAIYVILTLCRTLHGLLFQELGSQGYVILKELLGVVRGLREDADEVVKFQAMECVRVLDFYTNEYLLQGVV